jgi:hypothetical protein
MYLLTTIGIYQQCDVESPCHNETIFLHFSSSAGEAEAKKSPTALINPNTKYLKVLSTQIVGDFWEAVFV